jgi:thiamine transport system substrate-binding protein
VIFANGVLANPTAARDAILPNDLLIAADGGLRHCRALGLTPQVLIGDFDSISSQEVTELEAAGIEVIRHPAQKDYTDLELALQHSQALGAHEILVLAALGERWDQTLANLLLPAAGPLQGTRITLLDGAQEIHLLDARQCPAALELRGEPGDTVSLIPLTGDAEGIRTTGLEYPLESETLSFGKTRGVSNSLIKREASIILRQGLLACIVIHNRVVSNGYDLLRRYKMFKSWLPILITFSLVLASCAQAAPTAAPTPAGPRTLTVMTHDSFAASEPVIAAFESQNNLKVRFFKAGDTGTALNKAILSKNNPLADVFYGVDNTLLSRALTEDIYEPYNAAALANIPSKFKLDPQNRLLPVDYGDVCPNYAKNYFSEKNLAIPQNLDDLRKPEYKDLLVVENPATSSPGLAFLLATIGLYGQDGYLTYWKDLVANGVKVVNDWETAYYTEFSAHGGTRPIVISYGSSPPAEVVFAETPIDQPPTAAITGGRSCFRQIEFVGILKGTPNRDLAEKWVDFMLSTAFQEDMPLQMYVFPVNPAAKLPEVFTKFTSLPDETAQVSPEDISQNRELWIKAWTESVLR